MTNSHGQAHAHKVKQLFADRFKPYKESHFNEFGCSNSSHKTLTNAQIVIQKICLISLFVTCKLFLLLIVNICLAPRFKINNFRLGEPGKKNSHQDIERFGQWSLCLPTTIEHIHMDKVQLQDIDMKLIDFCLL